MRLTLRQSFMVLVILILLANENIFRITVNLLIIVHVFTTILFGWLNTCVNVYFPRLSNKYMDEFEDLRARIAIFLAPRVRAVLVTANPVLLHWVRESPGYLCEVNLAVAEYLNRTLERLPGNRDPLAEQDWAIIQQAAQAFCSLVEDNAPFISRIIRSSAFQAPMVSEDMCEIAA